MSPKQIEAIKLLARGSTQEEVANAIRVAKKTIQRWVKIPEFSQAILDLQAATLNKIISKTSDAVSDDLSEISRQHFESLENFKVLVDLVATSILREVEAAQAGDETSKALLARASQINCWSQIQDRTLKLQRTVLGLHYEDVSSAIAFLHRMGYEVCDPSLQPATNGDGEAAKSVAKGLNEQQLNQIRAEILGISEN